jgi:hypothetical protein
MALGSWLLGAAWLPTAKQQVISSLWNARLTSLAQTPEEEAQLSQMGKVLSGMQLRITAPKRLRLGEEGQLLLEVIPASQEALMAKGFEGHVVLEARPELPGIQVRPIGSWSEVLDPRSSIHVLWWAGSHRQGIYRGIFWVYLRVNGAEGRASTVYPLLAYPLEIHVDSVLGFSQTIAGGMGLALWGLSSLLVIWHYRNFVNNHTN